MVETFRVYQKIWIRASLFYQKDESFHRKPPGGISLCLIDYNSLHDPCGCHKSYMAFEYLLVGHHQRTRGWKLLLGSQAMSTTVTLIFRDCHVITSKHFPLLLGSTKKVQDKVKKLNHLQLRQ